MAATPTTPSRAISQTTSHEFGSLGERDAEGGGEANPSILARPSSSLVVGIGGCDFDVGEAASSSHPIVTRLKRNDATPAPMAKPSPAGWEPSQSRWSLHSFGREI